MTQPDYEQKKGECWEEYTGGGDDFWGRAAFDFAFAHAYALGQQNAQLLNNPKQLDAEGETKMLCVSRKKVQELYKRYCTERDKEKKRTVNRIELRGRVAVLEELFSRSMCLPDDAEDGAKDGAKGDTKDGAKGDTKDATFTDERKSLCKSPDRLRIAAMVMQAILGNSRMSSNLCAGETTPEAAVACIVRASLMYADALIAEGGKGSSL